VRVVAELLRPFMPHTGERMLEMVGVTPSPRSWVSLEPDALQPGSRIGETQALFPRIDHSVEELRHMASDQQEPSAPVAPQAPVTAAPAATHTPPDDRIAIDDFMKVELRVAKVLAAERVPKSNRLLKLHVDVGTEQRTLVAGIAEAYEPDALVGRSVVIVFNLKPAKLMGIESNGMVLAASPDGGKPALVGFDDPPAPGTRVR
jgi:methionyl-tRNA synthetase